MARPARLTGATRQGRCSGLPGARLAGSVMPESSGFQRRASEQCQAHPQRAVSKAQTPRPASPEPGQARRLPSAAGAPHGDSGPGPGAASEPHRCWEPKARLRSRRGRVPPRRAQAPGFVLVHRRRRLGVRVRDTERPGRTAPGRKAAALAVRPWGSATHPPETAPQGGNSSARSSRQAHAAAALQTNRDAA